MRRMHPKGYLFLVSVLLLGGAGCQQEGQAEKAGKKLDAATEQASQVVRETTEKIETAGKEAVEAARAEAEKAKKATD